MTVHPVTVRTAQPEDHRATEELARECFWNLYVPGATEHFIVHELRRTGEAVPELDLVACVGDQLVGAAMGTTATVEGGAGTTEVAMLGPICVAADYRRQGVANALMDEFEARAVELGFPAVALYGYPEHYRGRGFVNGKEFGVTDGEGNFPVALQVKELVPGALAEVSGALRESTVFHVAPEDAEAFENSFPPLEKRVEPSQARFMEMLGEYA